MADDSPKTVEARPIAFCETHKEGVAEIRDQDGNTHLQPFKLLDPDFPLPEEGPVLQVKGRSEDGWFHGEVTTRRGPPKVNSEAYRRGWERIFGNKTPEGEA